jgi:hypothetical protein
MKRSQAKIMEVKKVEEVGYLGVKAWECFG